MEIFILVVMTILFIYGIYKFIKWIIISIGDFISDRVFNIKDYAYKSKIESSPVYKQIKKIESKKEDIKTKIDYIQTIISKITNNMNKLYNNKDNIKICEILEKHDIIIRNMIMEYFDKYSSMYLYSEFILAIERMKSKGLNNIDIDADIKDLQNHIDHVVKFTERYSLPDNKYKKYNISLEEFHKMKNKIYQTIISIQGDIAIAQTNNQISGLSPIDDNTKFEIFKIENENTEFIELDRLDNQYDKFISEMEILKTM
jgi:hypothetical protein